jgi:hypothetical protein
LLSVKAGLDLAKGEHVLVFDVQVTDISFGGLFDY